MPHYLLSGLKVHSQLQPLPHTHPQHSVLFLLMFFLGKSTPVVQFDFTLPRAFIHMKMQLETNHTTVPSGLTSNS